MEKIEFEKLLLESIKRDDVNSFSLLMSTNADMNLSYGRFPILSLLYLYSSFKILAKFEKRLLPIHNFRFISEPVGIYSDFKRVAKKSLRLFQGDEVVYPILMLAVLDERFIIDKNYKFLHKNVEIVNKIEIIYNLNHKTQIEIDEDYVDLPSKKMQAKHYVLASVMSLIFCVIIALSAVMMVLVLNRNGLGTESRPIKISSAAEFGTALGRSGKHYVLINDLTISSEQFSINDFDGVFDGAGHTIIIDGEIASPMMTSLSGQLKNLNIKLSNNQIKITQNSAIIAQKNTGIIENCQISGNFTQSINSDDEVHSGLYVVNNLGKILNCTTMVSGVLENIKESNAYFGLFAGVNEPEGEIANCVANSGILIADTVDLAGVVAVNNGLVRDVSNKVNIVQSSSKKWHPNVGGISVLNYGSIEQCVNFGELSSESEVLIEEETPYYVFVGGMSCENYGNINDCTNIGQINGKGEISNVVAAGIAAQNIKDEKHEGLIKSSLAKSNIKAFSEQGQVCVGGVVGINSSVVLNSGCIGSIDANANSNKKTAVFMNETDKALAVVSGGVVGVNQNAPVQNSYANVDFVCGEEIADVLKIYSGVIGSMGMYRYSYSSNPLIVFNYPNAYMYIRNNFYVEKTEIKQCAYGVYGSLDDGGYYKGGVAEAISETGNESLMKKCASFEEIPAEVRGNA